MAKNKLDKEDLKGPDAFVSVSERVFKWLEGNLKVVGAIVGMVLLVSVAYFGYGMFKIRVENNAADALFAVEGEIKKIEQGLLEKKTTPDFEKDFMPVVQRFKSAIRENSSSRASLVSTLNLVVFLLEKKQFSEALDIIDLPTYRPSGTDVMAGFLYMHKGLVYIENKKYDEAIQAYQSVLSGGLKYFHSEAMLKMGVAFELKGDSEKAKSTYQDLIQKFPQSDAAKTAEQYVHLIETKTST